MGQHPAPVGFGRYLRDLIHTAGYATPTQFARKVGTDPSVVLRWISEEQRPTIRSIERIAPVLGHTIHQMVNAAYPESLANPAATAQPSGDAGARDNPADAGAGAHPSADAAAGLSVALGPGTERAGALPTDIIGADAATGTAPLSDPSIGNGSFYATSPHPLALEVAQLLASDSGLTGDQRE